MLSEGRGVRGELGSPIDELEVQLLVIFAHLRQDLPEPFNSGRTEALILCVLLQDLDVDNALAHGADFGILPAQEFAGRFVNDEVDSAQEVLHLDCCLVQEF